MKELPLRQLAKISSHVGTVFDTQPFQRHHHQTRDPKDPNPNLDPNLSYKNFVERKENFVKKLHHDSPKRVLGHLAQKLADQTHFNPEEVKNLLKMYGAITKNNPLKKDFFSEVFTKMFDITNKYMLERIFYVFSIHQLGYVTDIEWVHGLSHYLRGTFEEQIGFAYGIYDVNGDMSIGREEVDSFLSNCLSFDPDDLLDAKDLVEMTMRQFEGKEKDDNISFECFRTSVYNSPLMLEALGNFLPNWTMIERFLHLISTNTYDYTSWLSRPQDPGWRLQKEQIIGPDHLVLVPEYKVTTELKIKSSYESKSKSNSRSATSTAPLNVMIKLDLANDSHSMRTRKHTGRRVSQLKSIHVPRNEAY